jgi:hypothetical protein
MCSSAVGLTLLNRLDCIQAIETLLIDSFVVEVRSADFEDSWRQQPLGNSQLTMPPIFADRREGENLDKPFEINPGRNL